MTQSTSTLARPADVLSDPCDRCGALAAVRVRLLNGGRLCFCIHHGKEQYDALISRGATFSRNPYEVMMDRAAAHA